MPGFIHGELNWVESVDAGRARVQEMLKAVDHYPWAQRVMADGCSPTSTLVVAAQDFGAEAPHVADPGADLLVFGDLQLHGKDDLASQVSDSSDSTRMSDATLVASAYRAWGLEFAGRVIAEGVVAIWDGRAQRLILWRDAAGVRPMYYRYEAGRAFVFSSDLQALAAHPLTKARLDMAYTNAFIRNELFQHPTRTMVDGVHKLPAAHLLVVEHGQVTTHRYWDPRQIDSQQKSDDRESIAELLGLLRLAIEDRFSTAVGGVGTHLSGGLDSSGVAMMASELLQTSGRELDGFSWAPPRDVVETVARDERDLVDAVATFGAIRVHYTHLTPQDAVDVAYRDVALRPRATLNFEVATSRNAVQRGARMIISGWGGDEMIAFNGRGHFSDLARRGRLLTVRRELQLRAEIHGGSLLGAWKARVLMPLAPDWMMNWRPQVLPPLPPELRPDFARELMAIDPLSYEFPRERPGVHRMQADLLDFGHLQYRMESWAAHGATLGLVYTFPLLDRRVMELAMRLPGHMFFRDGWKRWLYRKAMEGRLPEEVRWNPKKYDDAAEAHLRQVLLEPAELYRDRLLEQRENSLVDVQILLDEQVRRRALLDNPRDSSPSADTRIGGGAWLAFTTLRPS